MPILSVPSVRFSRSLSVAEEDYTRFKGYWREIGVSLRRNIRDYTGLQWRRKKVRVHIKPESGTSILGQIETSEPYDIMLYLAPDNRTNMSTMTHELVHLNVWSNYGENLRWMEMHLFEDIFADELLTEIISQKLCIRMNIGGRRRINYSWAIHYGFITTFERIGDIIGLELPENFKEKWGIDRRTQSSEMKSFRAETKERLVSWSKNYFRKVRKGRTNAIVAHKKIVELLPSLSEHFGKEMFFR